MQGAPALSHQEYLSPPLTAEDLPHTLLHRDCWLVDARGVPFSLSGLSPDGLDPTRRAQTDPQLARIEAGLGWFRLIRRDPARRVVVAATLWCPAELHEPIELMQVSITNTSPRPLLLVPYLAIPLFARSADHVRDHRHVTALLHRMRVSAYGVTVQPTLTFDERGHRPNRTRYTVLAIGPRHSAPTDVWAREADFVGVDGSFAAPAAVWARQRAPRYRPSDLAGREAIGAFRFTPCRLAPQATAQYLVISGIAREASAPRRWLRWARRPHAPTQSLRRTQKAWVARAHRIAFVTADRAFDHWMAWVAIQPTLRRLYGNSYLPQFDYGRGGRGWRDLWQDCLALLLSEPDAVRSMLLRNFAGVRIDGSNATIIDRDGRFLADRNNIPRTWMDHGVWPTYTTLLYLDQTGDTSFLLEPCAYFRDPQLFRCRQRDPAWSEAYGFALRTHRGTVYRGSVWEHLLVQTLTAFFNVGEHHLCRLEGADWNDGLDMASQRGESVAFSAFYAWNLRRLAELATRLAAEGLRTIDVCEELLLLLDRRPRGRPVPSPRASAKRARLEAFLRRVSTDISGRRVRISLEHLAEDLRRKHDALATRIHRQEWVRARGTEWFNGYYDNRGRRVEGARPGGGVRMTLPGQVFPLMAGIATDTQVTQVIRAVNRWLRDPRSGGVRLNTDFKAPQPHLGRAFFFSYGDKENGSVFSHMAVMYAYALYLRRRPEAGAAVWKALYRMATDQSRVRMFPCLPEYFTREGRGLYGYLTGSASWLLSLLLTQAYGIRGEHGDLAIDPQLTPEEFAGGTAPAVAVSFAGRPLTVQFSNPERLSPAAYRITEVGVETRTLTWNARPAGGIVIARRVLTRLPAHRRTRLLITLGRGTGV